ncbi:MAG: DMT family transporter, partial [Pseudomonadota bacterium]
NTILYLAAHSTTAINITLFSASIPIITLIMSTVLLKHKPSRWQLLGIACSFLGVAIIVTKGSFYQLLSLTINPGDLMVIGIACVWSLYSVLLRKYPINLKPLALLTTFIAAGLPWLLVLTVIEWMAVPNIHVTGADGLLFLYIAVFPSILAYLFWTYGVTTVGPNVAALSTYLMPLFTAAIAIPLLGERLAVSQLLGGLLILAGLYLGSLFRANPH